MTSVVQKLHCEVVRRRGCHVIRGDRNVHIVRIGELQRGQKHATDFLPIGVRHNAAKGHLARDPFVLDPVEDKGSIVGNVECFASFLIIKKKLGATNSDLPMIQFFINVYLKRIGE